MVSTVNQSGLIRQTEILRCSITKRMMQSNKRVWKSVDGSADYAESNLGGVRNVTDERIVKLAENVNGYSMVGLFQK